ncbi:MAG: carboxymuconolactone decarboxylase family protein [Candidatus Obscuribacterales bacterium]|nr:carboxymuconolactone decarboxylase family protein [Candidatus Obscuribacterales bacterium]
MSRLNVVTPESASGKTKELFDGIKAKLGRVPNIFTLMGNSPAALEAYLKFSEALAGGVLDAKLRELIAICVAETNVCEYCLSAHFAIGKSVGLNDEELALAREQRSNDPKFNAALRFVRIMVTSRAEMSDTDLVDLKAAGFSDAEVAEIIANVGLNLYTNYFNHIAKPEVDFPKVKTAFPV